MSGRCPASVSVVLLRLPWNCVWWSDFRPRRFDSNMDGARTDFDLLSPSAWRTIILVRHNTTYPGLVPATFLFVSRRRRRRRRRRCRLKLLPLLSALGPAPAQARFLLAFVVAAEGFFFGLDIFFVLSLPGHGPTDPCLPDR